MPRTKKASSLQPDLPLTSSGISRVELLPHERVILSIELEVKDWPIEALEWLYGLVKRTNPTELEEDNTDDDIRNLIRRKKPAIIRRLLKIVLNGDTPDATVVSIARELLDREEGRSAQAKEVQRDDDVAEIHMTDYGPKST